jgi:hypothetical protein
MGDDLFCPFNIGLSEGVGNDRSDTFILRVSGLMCANTKQGMRSSCPVLSYSQAFSIDPDGL